MIMSEVHGHYEERFKSLVDLVQRFITTGDEQGASLAVEINGKLVVDIWGGYADADEHKPWQQDTIVNVWSCTKTVGSLAVLLLADRGMLDLDEKVSKYWPEYAANGKENTTVRNLISHTAGVPGWEEPIEMEDYYDVDEAAARLARQAPLWPPGTKGGYHVMTHGHLISQLVQRTTGQTLKQFIAEEIAGPLGADFGLGAAPSDYSRIAKIIGPEEELNELSFIPPPDSILYRLACVPTTDPRLTDTKEWRDAGLGSCNGHGNGRSIARILSAIALGGDDTIKSDNRLTLSAKMVDEIFVEQAHGPEIMLGGNMCYGTGYALPRKNTHWDWSPTDGRVCGWGGWGGSMAIADVGRRMTIGYAMNKMHNVGLGSKCARAYVKEIYRILGAEV